MRKRRSILDLNGNEDDGARTRDLQRDRLAQSWARWLFEIVKPLKMVGDSFVI